MSKTAALIWVSPAEGLPPPDMVVLAAVRKQETFSWTYYLVIFTPDGHDDEGDYQAEQWEDSVGGVEMEAPAFWAIIHGPEAIEREEKPTPR